MRTSPPLTVALVLALASPALALQNGDRAGEQQPAIDRDFDVPAAPALTPAQELATFALPPGYRIELAAGDPLIDDPVEIAFDERGRMWVVEMKGFMPDADGTREAAPVGSIATLEDRDGDGYFEHRTTFADQLVLPRGLCFANGGVVAVLPPRLVWMADRDGDGRADLVETIDEGGAFEAGIPNLEHAPNAPTLGLDNWLYLANHKWRYRLVGDGWQRERVPVRGQWGLGMDDWGRQLYDYNSTPVRGDRVPPHYLVRNPALGQAAGANAGLVQDTATWPSRITPGVNRGYRPETLRPDGRLANYTAACGPAFFTGTALAPEDRGDSFVCEPAANLVRHNRMTEHDGRLAGENAWGQSDFLTSTDERFRPVNIENGPDGALYVVDMYRGILQHRVFMTSFLRRQVEERGLDVPLGLGRVWRIVHDEGRATEPPSSFDTQAWVERLDAPNGWTRSTAQRVLIERRREAAAAGLVETDPLSQLRTGLDLAGELERVARGEPWQGGARKNGNDRPSALGRLHALWTLEGLGALEDELLNSRLDNETDERLLAQLVRLSEDRSDERQIGRWLGLATSDSRLVRWQLAQSLGERPASFEGQVFDGPAIYADPLALAPRLLEGREQDPVLRQGLLSGLAGRELDLFDWLDPNAVAWTSWSPVFPYRTTVEEIGACIGRRAERAELERLFERVAHPSVPAGASAVATLTSDGRLTHTAPEADLAPSDSARPAAVALLRGFARVLDPAKRKHVDGPPPMVLVELLQHPDEELRELVHAAAAGLSFGDAEVTGEPGLSAEELAALEQSITRGTAVYAVSCAACHQATGLGIEGLAPPFKGSEWLDLEDERLAEIALFGLAGEIEVAGKPWNLVMPPWGHLSDRELADTLTYVRSAFGSGATSTRRVLPELIAEVRARGPADAGD